MTVSITTLNRTMICRNAKGGVLFIIMLSVMMLSVVLLGVVAPEKGTGGM